MKNSGMEIVSVVIFNIGQQAGFLSWNSSHGAEKVGKSGRDFLKG